MNISNIFAIIKKELRQLLNNPASYLVVIVFLLLWEFLFFRNAFLVGEGTLRILYDTLPWLLFIFVGALTMGSIAKEKDDGTLELLLTHPITDLELVIGKFTGISLFMISALLFSITIAYSFSQFSVFDWGQFAGQLCASIFLAMSLIALGIFISSSLSSQVSALLVSVTGGFILLIIGSELITAHIAQELVPLFDRLSIISHYNALSRGVLDIRDLWYYSAFIVIFLSLTYLNLLKRKYGNQKKKYRSIQVGILLFIAIAVVTTIIGDRIPGRIDLTKSKRYSVSNATRHVLTGLTDIVTITLYASGKLPAQFTPIVRDTKDMLRDYQTYAKGNISVNVKDPSNNPQETQEAAGAGIKEVQFNVIGNEEFQIKTGFLGLVVSYAGNTESIPFIEDISGLEYQLTSFIRKLTVKDKKTIAFLSGNGEKSIASEYRILNTELSKQFQLKTSVLGDTNKEVSSDSATLVIAGPVSKIEENKRRAIKDYLDSGKNIALFIDQFLIGGGGDPVANPNENSFADVLTDYGITVQKDLVYDLRSNETIRVGSENVQYLLAYPFWIRAIVGNQITNNNRQTILLPWASSITADDVKVKASGYQSEKIITTSMYANHQTEGIAISPDKLNLSRENLQEFTLGILLQPTDQSAVDKKGKILIVGDSDFLTDQIVQNSPDNLSIGLALLSSLTESDALKSIPITKQSYSKLLFSDSTQIELVKYANMSIAFIIPAFYGFFRLRKRQKMKYLIYKNR